MKFIEVLNNLKQKALEQNKKGIEDVLSAKLKSHERIFPILNKLDALWSKNPELTFCDLVKLINTDEYIADLQLTKRLDDLIDGIQETK